MEDFIIKIRNSDEYESELIFITRNNIKDAFDHMFDIALQNFKALMSENKYEDLSIRVSSECYDILIDYGYYGKQCYYRLIKEK